MKTQLPTLVALMQLGLAPGCESVTELGLRVILPEDVSELDDVDNLLLVLEPDGRQTAVAIDGLDFSVELELPADAALRANLFLARGAELRAWGRSATFYTGAASGLAIFVGPPGVLSTFPAALDDQDPDLLAAALPNRGLFMMDGEGATFLLSEFSYAISAGEAMRDPPDPGLGHMHTVQGGVAVIAWGSPPTVARFDAEESTWEILSAENFPEEQELDASSPRTAKPGEFTSELFAYGSTQPWRIDISELDRFESEGSARAAPFAEAVHDGPRADANALGLELEGDEVEYLVFGSPDTRPCLWSSSTGSFGPPGPWISGRCVQIDPASDTTRVLCAGGKREDTPSSDLLLLTRAADESWMVEERPSALPIALSDPLWLSDEIALYAQSDGQVVRIARDSLLPDNDVSSAQRFARGHSVELPTGATFLVGGLGNEGQPLTRWQVFTPALEP